MDWGKIVKTARMVLGRITDLLLVGRTAGWWSRRPTILGLDSKGDPHKPGTK